MVNLLILKIIQPPMSFLAKSLLLGLLTLNTALAVTATATLERNPIRFDETVRLIIEVDDNFSGQTPDLGVLDQNFTVRGTSTSSNTSIINGQTTSSTRWFVRLEPKKEGVLAIPSINIGQLETNPTTLTVLSANANLPGQQRDAFIEAEVQPQEPYVQSQLTYIAKLYVSANVINGSLGEPRIEAGSGDAIVQRIGEDVLYEAKRGQQRYRVVERRYAIFPQQSGELKIESLRFQGQISAKTTSGVLNNQFTFSQEIETRSKPLVVFVKPQPQEFTGDVWLPLSDLSLNEQWSKDPSTFRVGEPLTRTITLRATGANDALLPSLSLPEIEGIRVYPDRAEVSSENDHQWVISSRTERLAMVPSVDGELTLPEINIPWWNTQTDSLEYALLPARNIKTWPALEAADSTGVATSQNESKSDENETINVTRQVSQPHLERWLWPTISVFFLIAWLITLSLLWRVKHNKQSMAKSEPPQKQANLKDVKSACLKHDPVETRRALMNWAALKWPQRRAMTIQDIAVKLQDKELTRLLENLNSVLYSQNKTDWNGTDLWSCLQRTITTDRNQSVVAPTLALPDLHPVHT